MCGISGIWKGAGAFGGDELPETTALRMARRLRHRGPDAQGAWSDPGKGIALGHARLAIIDLSPAGTQPMHSASGRYVIAYNGEIYNFREIRRELGDRAPPFKGGSDTEVLLAAIEAFGIEGALERANGMFAFALWDRELGELTLARDRFGKKPLYWCDQDGTLAFGSELKALAWLPGFGRELDPTAVGELLRCGYIRAPHCIYRGTRKVAPGTLLRFSRTSERGLRVESRRYYRIEEVFAAARASPFAGTAAGAVEVLGAHISEATRIRMIADVPVGAFLSGGIDSSTIVATMQRLSVAPVHTFTIGFREQAFNEAAHAERVARHLGTEHTELYVSPQDALRVVDDLAGIYDEPFADSSQLPTVLLARLAARHVKVALSGDGGDEFFYGYSRYERFRRVWRATAWLPPAARRALGQLVAAVPAGRRSAQLRKVAALVSAPDRDAAYELMCSHWMAIGALVPRWRGEPLLAPQSSPASLEARMMNYDAACYLPDDVLAKVDRATMSVSLESRAPLLDRNVVEFACSLPLELKGRPPGGKLVLRQLLAQHVPAGLFERPKMGFGVPIGRWLRSELRGWAEELLAPAALDGLPLVSPGPVRARWSEHLAGRVDWSDSLWDVLMLQAWRRAEASLCKAD
jgi:asparagine synthase (glutamine-hydrolysing)